MSEQNPGTNDRDDRTFDAFDRDRVGRPERGRDRAEDTYAGSDEGSWSLRSEVVLNALRPPHEFTSTRGDVERLAEAEVRQQFAEVYEDLPGALGGLGVAAAGASAATAFFVTLGTLWFLLPAILAACFTVVFLWAGLRRRGRPRTRPPQAAHARD
ncbi:hypothetical protein OHT52_12480 [Streptomyces sp. NBC_00247]|uniref:hypothetical protein n=1 Tax=Streptomyces sp. NBC_00247 TaxID=2975689 RepID=UPI002E2A3A0B|nr:hypothetical protein [Streptomyces sp. NBC_00247]